MKLSPSFVHLYVQSEYSLLKSTARVPRLVSRAKKLGMNALALTDDSVMYGVIPFYRACREAGIHPVIGLKLWIADLAEARWCTRQDARRQDAYGQAVVLLAENNQGYQNLLQLSTLAQQQLVQGSPRVSFEQLTRHREGLILLSGGIEGEVDQALVRGEVETAREVVLRYRETFGKDQFFLQLEDRGVMDAPRKETVQALKSLGSEIGVSLVVTGSVQAVEREDAGVLPLLKGIREAETLENLPQYAGGWELTPPEEIQSRYPEIPWALENTRVLAERCRVEIQFGQSLLPHYHPLPEGFSAYQYLCALCKRGAQKRYGRLTEPVRARLKQELSVIQEMGFVDYFLIVWDFVRYAHQEGIMTGPGRGSAAGSLVAYVLGITKVDPLKYNLLFERFLNPARVGLPDIDIDFSYDRRDEVIRYVAEKYGYDRVAQIVTFGTMAAKAAIRDVGRVLAVPPAKVDRLSRFIPSHQSLAKVYEGSPGVRRLLEQDAELARLFQLAQKVEGLPRHTSTHAAGVVVAPGVLVNWIPLLPGTDSLALTQYPMEVLEQLGFLKIDFLGLKNLTIIETTVKHIQEDKGIHINFDRLDDDDSLVYELLARGDTSGVFQLESEGMRNVLRQLRPTCFEDIVAVLSLYRPGPSEYIPHYIRAKHGEVAVSYPHPSLEPILKDTYGIIVYQEQIMQIAATMAGFSLGEADLLRRAVSKKKREILDEERQHFVQGCLKNGYSEEEAHRVYDMIVRFASYGFNRSHAVAYAVVAYQTAYLKAYYPQEFMAVMMSESIGSREKLQQYQRELRHQGIRLLPPDVQYSTDKFTVEGSYLRFPLSGIKQVGTQAIEAIVQAREAGPFEDLFDFCRRVNLKHCHRRVMEALIQSGAMDSLRGGRAQLLAVLDEAMEQGAAWQAELYQPQLIKPEKAPSPHAYPDVAPYSQAETWRWEVEMLGMHLSAHPLETYEVQLKRAGVVTTRELAARRGGEKVWVCGILQDVRQVRTKKGALMAFARLEDLEGTLPLVIFPAVYRLLFGRLREGDVQAVYGQLGTEGKFVIETMEPLEPFLSQHQFSESSSETSLAPGQPQRQAPLRGPVQQELAEADVRKGVVKEAAKQMPAEDAVRQEPDNGLQDSKEVSCYIRIASGRDTSQVLERLKALLLKYHGNCPVILYYEEKAQAVKLKPRYWVSKSEELVAAVTALLGTGAMAIHEERNLT